jgi:hypothetical protein
MNLEFRIPTYNNASSNNFNFNNEKIQCTPINSVIYKFIDAPKIMDYEIIIYFIASSQNFHPLSLFQDKNSKGTKVSNIVLWVTLTNFCRFFISTNSSMELLHKFEDFFNKYF